MNNNSMLTKNSFLSVLKKIIILGISLIIIFSFAACIDSESKTTSALPDKIDMTKVIEQDRLDPTTGVSVSIFFYDDFKEKINYDATDEIIAKQRQKVKEHYEKANTEKVKKLKLDNLKDSDMYISQFNAMVLFTFEAFDNYINNKDAFINISGYNEVEKIYIESPQEPCR